MRKGRRTVPDGAALRMTGAELVANLAHTVKRKHFPLDTECCIILVKGQDLWPEVRDGSRVCPRRLHFSGGGVSNEEYFVCGI